MFPLWNTSGASIVRALAIEISAIKVGAAGLAYKRTMGLSPGASKPPEVREGPALE